MNLTKRRRMVKKTGFSLIELLVVIAIISMLAAMLFPVFSTAREKARRASCLNNMKQVGLMLNMFAADHQEFFPNPDPYNKYWKYNLSTRTWEDANPPLSYPYRLNMGITEDMKNAIEPYVKNPQILYCPSDKFVYTNLSKYWNQVEYDTGDPVPRVPYIRIGYTYLAYIPFYEDPYYSARKYIPMTTASVDLSKQVILVDRALKNVNTWDNSCINHQMNRNGNTIPAGANHLFGDGRVEWFNEDVMVDTVVGYYDKTIPFKQFLHWED